MALYYFDTSDGMDRRVDEDGTEFLSRDAARFAAISLLPNIARDELPDGDNRTFEVSVRDEGGAHIFKASLTLKAEWLQPGV